jgi:hypothetical protein
MGALDRLKPESVVRQPVPRRVLNQFNQFIATHPGKLRETLIHGG